jgi:hypothetical protein
LGRKPLFRVFVIVAVQVARPCRRPKCAANILGIKRALRDGFPMSIAPYYLGSVPPERIRDGSQHHAAVTRVVYELECIANTRVCAGT